MKRIHIAVLIIIVSICIVAVNVSVSYKNKNEDYISMADSIFLNNFSLLCNNLNLQQSDQVNEQNAKYAYVCFSVFGLTSFAENEKINMIVHILNDLSENNALYSEIDDDSVEMLNKLCHNIYDQPLVEEVYENLRR